MTDLVGRGELELQPDAAIEGLAQRLLASVRGAPNHAHLGREITNALLSDSVVIDLYVTDSEIIERLNFFYA